METMHFGNVTREIFLKAVNAQRKSNKAKWYACTACVDGIAYIGLKAYGTSMQVLRINGITHDTPCDVSVARFNQLINNALDYHLNKVSA